MGTYALAALFMGAGSLHFIFASKYRDIVPQWVPHRLAVVYVSGAAEIVGGAGLVIPVTRPLAACGLILLLAVVLPANVYMALQAHRSGVSSLIQILLWLRLPLQPLLAWAVWLARRR
ncbi:MAG: DoxX family protein [Gemmatimonadaceae bacterium]